MTMERACGAHQQQHEFQKTQQQEAQPATHHNHIQQPPPLPPMTQQQVMQAQKHLLKTSQQHLLVHHENTHRTAHRHINHNHLHHQSIDMNPASMHRPVHPPPPPPPPQPQAQQLLQPSNLACSHSSAPSQHQQNITSACEQVVDTGLLSTSDINTLRNSLPAVPTRSASILAELAPRNSLQQHSYYNNTHHYNHYNQTSSLVATNHAQQHSLAIDSNQHKSLNQQHSATTHSIVLTSERHLSDDPRRQTVQQDNSPLNHDAVDSESASVEYNSQDHYTEQVIQAILAAKEALEKPIEERDERDILLIDNLCSLVHGFDVFPKGVRRALAAQAVLIVIDEKGKELIVHNEELDSFCVLIFGECEQLNVAKTMPIRYYNVGDSFGVCTPTTDTIRFVGHMITRCENCAFLCVKRDDFYTILTDPANYPNKEILRHRDAGGNIICVSQFHMARKSSDPPWSNHTQSNPFKLIFPDGHIITKATETCLLTALVDGYDRIDPEYVDDFLLLFRVFMTHNPKDLEKNLPPGMINLCLSLTKWLDQVDFKDRVVKIVLTWLSSYYHDFELNPEFSYLFFKVLESRLLHLSMNNQLHLLHVTLSTKSKVRHVTISRSSREQPLPFAISGGYEKNCGIFVTQVHGSNFDDCPYDNLITYLNHNGQMSENSRVVSTLKLPPSRHRSSINQPPVQLRPGDQILEINGINFSAIKLVEAQKKLDMSTHLSLTVKFNPSAFHEMRALPEGRRKSSLSSVSSVSPYPTSQKFTFNIHDHHLNNGNRNGNEALPPTSPLFSTNANFGFRSIIKTVPKSDKSRLSSLISSSKQFVKQIRDSTTSSANVETSSKTSDTISDDQSNELDMGKSKSSSDLSGLRGKDKQIESGLSNVVRSDDLNPASIAENQASNQANTLVNVLRVFNAANNDSRYLLVHEETTAREVVMVAVKEFNLTASSGGANQSSPGEKSISSLNWHLYEVSVVPESRTIKQKCLSEQTSRLAERASLCSRLYIKNNSQISTGPSRLDMGDDSLVNEILKESPPNVTLTSLNATLLAVELTLTDFDKFRKIEPQQFVYDTFFNCLEKKQQQQGSKSNGSISSHDSASLKSTSSDGQDSSDPLRSLNKTRVVPKSWMKEYEQFADISNREMFWVICEILNERNIGRRVKIVKQFVRVADVCSQLRNYNSMFAIISGLGHSCVGRLRRTFEKLKPKYKNQLEKMRSLFDPSKNMSNYRICLGQTQPPAIPLFPQIKKDLTFTKEGRSIFIRESKDQSDDDESNGFSQSTIKRNGKLRNCASSKGDLLSVKSATTINHPKDQENHGQHHLPIVQTRSISYTNFNNAISKQDEADSCILINFAEIRQFTERVRNVIYFSSVPYSSDLLTNTKDNQRTQAQIKKMHEEWQMRKRIRHYISQTLDGAISSSQDHSSTGSGKFDQPDGPASARTPAMSGDHQPSNGKLSITYDERTLYQKSLEVEPELTRPQVSSEHHQQARQLPQHSRLASQSTRTSGNNSGSAGNQRAASQLSEAAAVLMNMQPLLTPPLPPPPALPSVSNSSPTLSKSSSLSSCSSFSQNNHNQVPNHLQHLTSSYHATRCSSNLNSAAMGRFGTESNESLRKLRLLSENAPDDFRSSYSSTNSRGNKANKIALGGDNSRPMGVGVVGSGSCVGLVAKNLIPSRIFPPRTTGGGGNGSS